MTWGLGVPLHTPLGRCRSLLPCSRGREWGVSSGCKLLQLPVILLIQVFNNNLLRRQLRRMLCLDLYAAETQLSLLGHNLHSRPRSWIQLVTLPCFTTPPSCSYTWLQGCSHSELFLLKLSCTFPQGLTTSIQFCPTH